MTINLLQGRATAFVSRPVPSLALIAGMLFCGGFCTGFAIGSLAFATH